MTHTPNAEPEQMREKIAFSLMLYELNGKGDWPAEKVWGALRFAETAHSGDCTKDPWTCMRCACDEVYARTDLILAQLAATPTADAKATVIATPRLKSEDGQRVTQTADSYRVGLLDAAKVADDFAARWGYDARALDTTGDFHNGGEECATEIAAAIRALIPTMKDEQPEYLGAAEGLIVREAPTVKDEQ